MTPLIFTLQAPLAPLPLYYALQEVGLPCTVTQPNPETLHCEPLDLRGGKHPTLPIYLTEIEQLMRIDSFVKGWVACATQGKLDSDRPLTVSRVPKPKSNLELTAADPWES